MAATIKVGSAKEVVVLSSKLKDPQVTLDKIGALLATKAKKAFREQRRGGNVWPPRMVPNVPGIVKDLNKGASIKARRFNPRPALVDTGILRNSITWLVGSSGRSVTVGTNVPYASRHNEGGSSVITLTGEGRKNLVLALRKARKARSSTRNAMLLGLGWLFSKPSFSVEAQRRPFLVIEDEDRSEIVAMIERNLEKTRGSR